MRKLFFFLLFLPFVLNAQFIDNFLDGDFTSNPTWSGDNSHFEINSSNQLHLKSTGADTSYLSTPNNSINNTEWQFWIKLSFNTSVNNNARVYLVSDQANIEGYLNGYFVQIGESNDSIALHKQSGNTNTKIISGTIANSGGSTNALRIKITRDGSGNWKLYSDPLEGNNFILEGSCFDNSFLSSSFFGIFCKYTSSNSTKFYFDDFYVGALQIDTIPPKISSLSVVSSIELDVIFSEAVEKTIAETVSNYSVNNTIGTPVLAILDAANPSVVHLTFPNSFTNGILNTLSVSNIEDLDGNKAAILTQDFAYYIPETFDIVINEIMADPDPPMGLPNYEYLELFNKTSLPVDINSWTLNIGTSSYLIPSYTIQPNSFLILAEDDAEPFLGSYSDFIGFSSFSLKNSDQTIVLFNSTGQIISTVSYTDNWYRDNNKKDGGWSLEQIDPLNPCGEEDNWKASVNQNGGTPGQQNSVFAQNPDNKNPLIDRVAVIDTMNIQVFFNEKMDSVYLKNLSNYFIDNNIGFPNSVSIFSPDYKTLILGLSSSLQKGLIYILTIKDSVTDCVGNIIELNSSSSFAIPETPEPFDIVINEVLSNPKLDGVDFVEIYNRSDKVFDLKDLTLSGYDTIALVLEDIENISENGYLIFPREYFVLSTNSSVIKQQYFTSNPEGFIEMPLFPSFNNDGGVVVIARKFGEIIDKFIYSEDMQFELLNSTDGVSLERLSYERPTEDKTNWHSAAEAVGFATPAYKNSQFILSENNGNEISVSPEIFSPDNDGYDDVLNINYCFDKPGFVANITIYDSRGRLIKYLIKNELLAVSGTFSWDGITELNNKANIGIYVIYVEIFNLEGNVKHYKKTAVLGGKL